MVLEYRSPLDGLDIRSKEDVTDLEVVPVAGAADMRRLFGEIRDAQGNDLRHLIDAFVKQYDVAEDQLNARVKIEDLASDVIVTELKIHHISPTNPQTAGALFAQEPGLKAEIFQKFYKLLSDVMPKIAAKPDDENATALLDAWTQKP